MADVLVVDDDSSVREVIRMALEDEGHVVTEVADADQALSVMRSSPVPLVVLVDLHLTGRGENPVLRAIEADPSLTKIHRVILLTASSPERAREAVDAIKGEISGHISKPFDLAALIESVATVAATLGLAS